MFYRNVIWVADTNYRIDGDNEYIRAHALADDLDPLLAADQVGAFAAVSQAGTDCIRAAEAVHGLAACICQL